MGVVWGDGNGVASQCGPVLGAGIAIWVQRLIRAAWRRIVLHGGEL